ncbi:MAG: hypothetical protein R2825_13695 [Saprospiraceae bacterium]
MASTKYDLNDPTDLDIMKAKFDMVSHAEWDNYIQLAEEFKMGYKNINILKSSSRKAGMSKYLSPKVINWVLDIMDKIDERIAESDEEE